MKHIYWQLTHCLSVTPFRFMQRLIVMAARCGLPLPRPPPPRYHWPFNHIRLLPHDPALMALPAVGGAGWKAISISSEVGSGMGIEHLSVCASQECLGLSLRGGF